MTVSGRFFPAQVMALVNLLTPVLELIRHTAPVIPIGLGCNVETARSDLSEKTARQAGILVVIIVQISKFLILFR